MSNNISSVEYKINLDNDKLIKKYDKSIILDEKLNEDINIDNNILLKDSIILNNNNKIGLGTDNPQYSTDINKGSLKVVPELYDHYHQYYRFRVYDSHVSDDYFTIGQIEMYFKDKNGLETILGGPDGRILATDGSDITIINGTYEINNGLFKGTQIRANAGVPWKIFNSNIVDYDNNWNVYSTATVYGNTSGGHIDPNDSSKYIWLIVKIPEPRILTKIKLWTRNTGSNFPKGLEISVGDSWGINEHLYYPGLYKKALAEDYRYWSVIYNNNNIPNASASLGTSPTSSDYKILETFNYYTDTTKNKDALKINIYKFSAAIGLIERDFNSDSRYDDHPPHNTYGYYKYNRTYAALYSAYLGKDVWHNMTFDTVLHDNSINNDMADIANNQIYIRQSGKYNLKYKSSIYPYDDAGNVLSNFQLKFLVNNVERFYGSNNGPTTQIHRGYTHYFLNMETNLNLVNGDFIKVQVQHNRNSHTNFSYDILGYYLDYNDNNDYNFNYMKEICSQFQVTLIESEEDTTILRIDDNDGSSNNSQNGFSIKYQNINSTTTIANRSLKICADNQTSSQLDSLTLLQNGSIGIGTNIPETKMHILHTGGGSDNVGLIVERKDNGNSLIELHSKNTGESVLLFNHNYSNQFALSYGDANSENLYLYKYGSNSGSKFVIDNIGNVGIGVASPTEQLEVTGGIRVEKKARFEIITYNPNTFGKNSGLTYQIDDSSPIPLFGVNQTVTMQENINFEYFSSNGGTGIKIIPQIKGHYFCDMVAIFNAKTQITTQWGSVGFMKNDTTSYNNPYPPLDYVLGMWDGRYDLNSTSRYKNLSNGFYIIYFNGLTDFIVPYVQLIKQAQISNSTVDLRVNLFKID